MITTSFIQLELLPPLHRDYLPLILFSGGFRKNILQRESDKKANQKKATPNMAAPAVPTQSKVPRNFVLLEELDAGQKVLRSFR